LIKDYLPNYFGSEWSFAQYKYTEVQNGITLCVFAKASSDLKEGIILLTDSGIYERIRVDYSTTECV